MNIENIKSLVELMSAHDLSRIEIREGETHILLRRGQPVVSGPAVYPTTPIAPMMMPQTAPATVAAGTVAEAPAAPADVTDNETLIRSPMVGTFYSAAEPDAPSFVSAGSVVRSDSVVCLIEAMKVFNEIKAEVSGRITKILVKNGQAVEYDQPLFAVVPA